MRDARSAGRRSYRRALITGATGGIGAAFARTLPASTDLLLSGRDEQRLSKLDAEMARENRAVETCAVDLTDPQAVNILVEKADAFGIDLLINNAGVASPGRFLQNPVESERGMVMLNVVAVVELTRRLLPGMLQRARKDGRRAGLVIVSSTTAFAPVPYLATYAATKAFDLHFAEAIAEELRREPVDVLALCPGATGTSLDRASSGGHLQFPQATDPQEVARAALRSLGDRTVRITGRLGEVALGPTLLPRRLLTGAVGSAMRLFVERGC